MLARDVMQTDVLVLRADDSIHDAAEQLEEIGATGAPVVDGSGRLVGVLTTTDIARSEHVDDEGVSTRPMAASGPDLTSTADAADFDEELSPTEAFGEQLVGRARIGDWMTPSVTTVAPQATLGHVCRLMVDDGIHRVFVIDDKRLVGVVSTRDVVGLLATPRGR
ncbi:MAG TPA: CBS domain-containing protein [Planctomycetota bacterium]